MYILGCLLWPLWPSFSFHGEIHPMVTQVGLAEKGATSDREGVLPVPLQPGTRGVLLHSR